MRTLIIGAAVVCCIFWLSGCDVPSTMETRVNALKRPVSIVSISKEGDVILSSADGKIVVVAADYYMARALSKMKPGDVVAR
jgi:hypothetical protein